MYTNTKSRNSSNKQTNKHHQTIKFTAEISYTEITFLEANVFILDTETYFKPTETFQYTHSSSCHPLGVKKGFIKGEALRLLRTNSSENEFKTKISHFRASLIERGYPESLITVTLSDIKLRTGNKVSYRNAKKMINESCLSSHNTILRCLILNKYSCKNGI